MAEDRIAEDTESRTSQILTCVILVSIAVAAIVLWRISSSLPFEANRWASGNNKIRFRMQESLMDKYRAGDFKTRDAVDRALGPDLEKNSNPKYRAYEMDNWDGNQFDLKVRFDDQGNVLDFRVYAR